VHEQHGSWSECADAQADLDPCWSQTYYVGFVVTRLKWFLHSFFSGFRIKKPKNEKGRRAFTLKPPATVTPSTISTGSNVNHVGFTAFLTTDVNSLFTYLIVPFDNVIINDGQGFDTSRYMFTCPVSGMYLFSSAIYSLHQNRLEVEIVKEGAMLFRVYAVGTCEYPLTPDQGFNSGIVRCNAGERVWARIYQYSSFAMFPSSKYSSFSGQLLWSLWGVSYTILRYILNLYFY
jgi:hypothetical protein